LKIDGTDIPILRNTTKSEERSHIFQEALNTLREIAQDGVFPDHRQDFSLRPASPIDEPKTKGQFENTNMRSMESALRYLRIHLLSVDMEMKTTQALFRIMKLGVRPNLVFDVSANEKRLQETIAALPKVRKYVRQETLLLADGTIISEEDYEKLIAYHKALYVDGQHKSWIDPQQLQNFIKVFVIMSFSWLILSSFHSLWSQSKKNILLLLTVLFLNLSCIRILLQFTELPFWQGNTAAIQVLLHSIPFSLGAILATLLLQIPIGICCCAVTSLLYTLMIGRGIYFFLVCSFSSFIAILFCRSAYLRSHILQAGIFSGLAFALGLFILEPPALESIHSMPWMEIVIPVTSGILSGLLAMCCLPPLEYIFHHYSNIRFFELYDYNHPLIQQLQTNAPGTYHHSITVASLAEQSAIIIHANPILCKTAALYHDIGKMEKPEYFIENQYTEENFHESKKPELSAMIIKNHVREGFIFGKKAKLPQPILDIIQQHHGDSFVRFFLEKAKSQEDGVPIGNETVFRYDGPKPQTKEAAIICIADAVEAASRALERQPSPQSTEELVTRIIQERLDNHQFDECPLTLKDLSQLKRVFSSILLSSLHARISYDSKKRRKP
jgi:putative nucleotidyltransferase with HDIG domain